MRRRGASKACPLCRAESDALTPVAIMYDEAVQLHIQKKFADCAEKAAQILAVDPDHGGAKSILADLHLNPRGWHGVPYDHNVKFSWCFLM